MTTLWSKRSAAFVVEIKIGNAWVERARFDVESAARESAREALADNAVRAVRVLAHDMTHTCTVAMEQEQGPVVRVPDKMRETGRRAVCVACGTSQLVLTDQSSEWVFCAHCERATPCPL